MHTGLPRSSLRSITTDGGVRSSVSTLKFTTSNREGQTPTLPLSVATFISIDTDSNAATGFDGFSLGLAGTEASWQNDFPFTQTIGTFNDGFGMSGDFFGSGAALISSAGDVAQKEWAISLDITFNETGLPVFPDGDFNVLIWTDAGAGDVSTAIPYTLATIPEPSGVALLLGAAGILATRRHRS